MEELYTPYYFDLSQFKHAALFKKGEFVWEALTQVAAYLQKFSLGQILAEIPSGAFVINPSVVSIGKGTIIEPGAYIKGPCIIGENCTIRQGAYIRGDLICGDHCVIGHDSEIKNAILLDGAHAAHFAYVGDSILGNKVNLGAGTKCANLKLDNGPVIIHHNGKRFPTGMRKFGAIIGDASQTGCNSVTNPGTLIGKNVAVCPCLNVGGVIPTNSKVMAREKPLISPR